MGRITVALLRKRAEHNNKELSTLEEISLHQENLEKIEVLDSACRNLQILYLQNNIIGKIENLGRMKRLKYINLALNNIQVIENLEGVESLEKLDLTVNFVFDVRDVKRLRANQFLRELYLTGNPCATYTGYRQYVITTLPNLAILDGQEVTRSERIRAAQELPDIMDELIDQIKENTPKDLDVQQQQQHDDDDDVDMELDLEKLTTDEAQKEFWAEEAEHTPQARYEMHKRQEAMQRAEELKKNPPKPKKERRLFREDGRPLNINEGGWDFRLDGQDVFEKDLVLDFPCYKHLDTSQIELDVEPTYVRITIKGKMFQLVLPEPVHPDKGHAKRSKITGHLVVTMPKVNPPKQRPQQQQQQQDGDGDEVVGGAGRSGAPKVEKLEVSSAAKHTVDYKGIVDANEQAKKNKTVLRAHVQERANDPDFVDDDDVPPLE
ncbi:hypothetical protein PTSG_04799 [Salpingoeca rosetta]|uniref:Dynein axonemal assembly factor 11-like CS domain-containing protein n=1 Tax=Salpingoeca rosetta (strain ATCC 50818 / BSB-021) TaxID=946362 RepID=F2U9Q8_SALR5|nr:uncharacterized protein PTSG_04799 [Salpingoeca rosetta]EGD73085.1 hypothetical protein PTSG_04799 [Salpingoeca rosetta]|eukprot:XP_004994116.1 hypothetical protein PTSG_04799 [Salpingoeca rosetta]